MNPAFSIFLILLLFAQLPCQAQVKSERLIRLEQGFRSRCEEAKVKMDSELRKLDKGYLGALDREMEKAKASGRLESALPVKTEIDAVKNGADPLPDIGANAPYEVKKLRGKYAEERKKIQWTHATALAGLSEKMETSLSALEADLTKAGQIDDAIAAKVLRESVSADPSVKEARDLLKFGLAGSLRPALVLRRGGDSLEVLVHYDSKGKISMQSPVENVRESTGKGSQLGNTKAKVLGEFVGAKGFQVDSYVSYQHVFDSKDLGGLVLNAIIPQMRHEEEGKRGLRLSFDPGAQNPHGNFGALLPTTSEPATYRISGRYLVPNRNRAIAGFQFVQGSGKPIGGQYFVDRGSWTPFEVVAPASSESGPLLMYLKLAEGKKIQDAFGDHIVIGEVKIELLKFSAFIQKKFDTNGGVIETYADPLKQPRFIANGELEAL